MNKARADVAVGFFVVVGFLILSMIVFFVSGIYFFRPGYHLTALFDYVGVIDQGAPVRFSGVRVGEVSRVRILKPEDERGKAKVEIKFFVEKKIEVRERYLISIQGNHIMSEPHVAITPVPEGGRILKDGEVISNGISPTSMDELIKRGESIAARFDKILEDVGDIVEDPETRRMLKESLTNMNQLLASMNGITSGQEEELRKVAKNLNRATDEMGTLLGRINQGQGTIGKLVVEEEIYQDLRAFVSDIKSHPWKLLKKG